jgi:uncharacterized protein YdaU (DUF1376 family)
MAKDPAFLFYTGDFCTGTQFLTDEQVGKYLRLLMAQHQHGHLTEKQVLHISKSYDKDVMMKFIKDSDGLWYNERLEIEIEKRRNYSESRKKNKQGKKNTSKSYDSHMDNKNENENKYYRNVEAFTKYRKKVFDSLEDNFKGKLAAFGLTAPDVRITNNASRQYIDAVEVLIDVWNDNIWHEQIKRNFKLDDDRLSHLMKDFVKNYVSSKQSYDEAGFKTHFINTIKKIK